MFIVLVSYKIGQYKVQLVNNRIVCYIKKVDRVAGRKYSDYEYFIMIDCDNVCSQPVKLEHILYYLAITAPNDVIFSSVMIKSNI